jgi:hypothetical protein
MTQLELLEQELFEHDISLFVDKSNRFHALSLRVCGHKIISINLPYNILDRQKRTVILHEYYHLKHESSLYDFNTSLQARRYRETRIHRTMIKEVLPPTLLRAYLEAGKQDFEIAEDLCIAETFVKEAISFYNNIGWN